MEDLPKTFLLKTFTHVYIGNNASDYEWKVAPNILKTGQARCVCGQHFIVDILKALGSVVTVIIYLDGPHRALYDDPRLLVVNCRGFVKRKMY